MINFQLIQSKEQIYWDRFTLETKRLRVDLM